MKKYEYVNVKIGKFIGAKSEEHRQIIDDYAYGSNKIERFVWEVR